MSDSQPRPDDNDRERVYEELLRHCQDRAESAVLLELAGKHFLPDSEGIVDLALSLMSLQRVKSGDLLDVPGYLLPLYWDSAPRFEARIIKACVEHDYKFLQRLYKAAELVDKGGPISWSIGVTGYALMAWLQLDKELGHCPSRPQLKERTEQVRKEDGVDPKFSQRQWEEALRELKPLIP